MKQKMTLQKSSETFVMFSEFFAVHGQGGDALSSEILFRVMVNSRNGSNHGTVVSAVLKRLK